MDYDVHIDAFESATGTKVKDRKGFMTAFRGLVSCCNEDEMEEEPESERPSIATALGKMKK